MPLDREETLRKAEKLLRQGRADLAIVEYRSVTESEPADWSTANTLGDLYAREGHTDRAVAEYARTADHLASQGFMPRAVALYRKILKIKPDDEPTMWQLGHISARQGLLVDARASFLSLAQRRHARGDRRGEAEARVRLGELDGADSETRLTGARAHAELGNLGPAIEQLKKIAADLREKGHDDEALNALREAAALAPEDADLKRVLVSAYAVRGELDVARQYLTSPGELQEAADTLFRQGREDDALSLLKAAAEADPQDMKVRGRIANVHLARGDIDRARASLTSEVADSDPTLLWALADIALREGRLPEGVAALTQALAVDPSKREGLVTLGCSVAESNADGGFECITIASRKAIAEDDWSVAAAAVNEFVERVPHHIPALLHLVEICVDGGLESTMHSAQARLADAYLDHGAGAEARVIAEDLVAREPWNRSNIERLRGALSLLGVESIDTVVADRLTAQSPFMTPDVVRGAAAPAVVEPEAPGEVAPPPAAPVRDTRVEPHAIDLSGILNQKDHQDEESETPDADEHDIDLIEALRGMEPFQGEAAMPTVQSIETVLDGVRQDLEQDAASPEVAEEHFKLAASYIDVGMTDEAMPALEIAARSRQHRFRASALLARLYMESGDAGRAVEWFERAGEATAPDEAAAHQLLYDLGVALEAQGEGARALAVFLELQSEAGEYRDVPHRLEHLMGS